MAPVKLSASTPFLNPDGTVSRPWFTALVKLIDMSGGDIIGVTPIANGGTGADNATDGFDNLSPLTTLGDLLTHNGTDNIRRGIGSAGQVLTVVAGAPQWQSNGAAPNAAPYVTYAADATLTNEQNLGALTSGMLRQTVAAGSATLAIATAGTDYVAPGPITTSGLTQTANRLLGRTTAGTGAIEPITVGAGLDLSTGVLSATGGDFYMSPLTTGGDPTMAELIFAPDGDVVMVPVAF